MTMMIRTFWLILLLAQAGALPAQLRLAGIFGDYMVLQRDQPVPVWGWASPGESVAVYFGQQVQAAVADTAGAWRVDLAPMPAQPQGQRLRVHAGGDSIVCQDVLVGEVWLASGQSNMEWSLQRARDGEAEAAAAQHPLIRLYTVPRTVARRPQADVAGAWAVCTPATAAGFSAVAYFFGRDLQAALDLPIGLIHSAWGGTPSEAWTSLDMLAGHPDFEAKIASIRASEEDFQAGWQQQQAQMGTIRARVAEIEAAASHPETALAYDDAAWPQMQVPIHFHNTEIAGFQGIAWMRKTFTLSRAQSQQDLTLVLGKIEQADRTFVNGEPVGETVLTHGPRQYTVPARLLRPGPNVIAVRVRHLRNAGGGIYEGPLLAIQGRDTLADLGGNWRYSIARFDDIPISHQVYSHLPGALYNGMIAPLIPYAIRGAIWYQGESNASRAYQYRDIFPKLILDWRVRWEQGHFPFLFVQLANFMPAKPEPSDDSWPELREAQAMTLSLPHTGMAVAIDIGETDDIHPRNKQDVGYRLSVAAQAIAYGRDLVYAGPRLRRAEVQGDHLLLTFDHCGSGLVAQGGGPLQGFAIAGAEGPYRWAQAEIISPTQVKVWHPDLPAPRTVRYAWANNPACNLYNQEGLPASPFRTDDRRGVTYGER